MIEDQRCREYIDRLLEEKDRWIDTRFAGSDRIHSEMIRAVEQRIGLQFEAADSALRLARTENDRHFASLNEFQQRLERLESTFVTKKQIDMLLSNVISKVVAIVIATLTLMTFGLTYFGKGGTHP